MSRVDDVFAKLRASGEKTLMPFVCAGHPRQGDLTLLLPALERAGAGLIGVTFPFSDPIGEGPAVTAAMQRAIQQGTSADGILREVKTLREWLKAALVAMVSVSVIHAFGGPGGFAGRARAAGFDGVFVPDLPVEEASEMMHEAAAAGLSMPLMIAPTTPLPRAEAIVKAATGYVYLLAQPAAGDKGGGVPDVSAKVAKLRQMTPLPIVLGFGVTSVEHVRGAVRQADGAAVGSALVRHMGEAAGRGKDPIQEAEAFLQELARGLRG